GGHDRGLDWRPFAEAMQALPPKAIVASGANAARIAATLDAAGTACRFERVVTLAEAVALVRAEAALGDTVLLSPGAPSFDQFRDYAERGCAFARMAGFDPAGIGAIEGLGIA
ncbi:MAG: UDP-N-acetylmuramoyl-L-alanine--D-glutamate ligase, partial [Xanthomonadales bacterium]|nr:UDP-N-acetylmuramoyl-L-alanine--D-glutamate ligase [Xanthomonadales bacterium]